MASVFRFEGVDAARRAPVARRDAAATQEIQVDDILETAEKLAPDPKSEPEPEPAYIPQRPLPTFARVSAPPSVSAPLPRVSAPPPRMSAPPPRMSAPPPRMSAPPPRMSAPPPHVVEARNAPSVAPVEIDVVRAAPPRRQTVADSTMQIILDLTRVPRRTPKRRLGWVVAMAIGGALLILVAGVMRRALSSDDDTRATLAAMVAPQRPAATTPSPVVPKATPSPPSTSPAGLAPSPVGTVVGPAGRVYIDGKQVRGTAAIVPCGNHAIRIAPASKAKPINVPCGGELKVN